jgi:hypothetical protein
MDYLVLTPLRGNSENYDLLLQLRNLSNWVHAQTGDWWEVGIRRITRYCPEKIPGFENRIIDLIADNYRHRVRLLLIATVVSCTGGNRMASHVQQT